MKATLSNHHQSPRKVRLVANLIRGKKVADAQRALTFMPKYAAGPVKKLLDSALANARNAGVSTDELVVKAIGVDKGLVAKRRRPFARGRSGMIMKRMSHVTIQLARTVAPKKTRKAKAAKTAA